VFIGKLPPIEYKVFKEYYSGLKSILPAQSLSQYFVSADVIGFQDEEEICVAKTSSAKATILLQKLAGPLEQGNVFVFQKLLQLMETHGNVATKDLANKMKNRLSSLKKEPAVPQTASTASGSSTPSGSNFAVIPHNNSFVPAETTSESVPSSSGTISGTDSSKITDLKGTYL